MNIIRNKYDKTIERIQFKVAKVEFDIELRGFLTAFEGSSSSGKTYFLNSLYNTYLNTAQEFKEKYNINGVYLLNTATVNVGVEDKDVISNLKKKKGYLILVDNADTLLLNRQKVVDYISEDFNNQYIVMSRGGIPLQVSTNHYSEIIVDGNVIRNKFLTSIQGWK